MRVLRRIASAATPAPARRGPQGDLRAPLERRLHYPDVGGRMMGQARHWTHLVRAFLVEHAPQILPGARHALFHSSRSLCTPSRTTGRAARSASAAPRVMKPGIHDPGRCWKPGFMSRLPVNPPGLRDKPRRRALVGRCGPLMINGTAGNDVVATTTRTGRHGGHNDVVTVIPRVGSRGSCPGPYWGRGERAALCGATT
jgi:hypothetical protein